jgi:hypothetical protein
VGGDCFLEIFGAPVGDPLRENTTALWTFANAARTLHCGVRRADEM